MHCYVCKTTEDLSIHARRSKSVSMICRPCRRARYQKNPKNYKKLVTETIPTTVTTDWNARANAALDRIIKKYA